MITGKNIFVTGGAGFIASHAIERLIESNHVTVFDNLQRNALKFSSVSGHKNLRFIQGDVLDNTFLEESMKGSDIVIHCAAIAGIYSVVKRPTMTMKVNLVGTYYALEAAVKHGVKLFVDFSTSEVYGPHVYKGTEVDLTTQGPVGEKRWTYAVSKLAAEHLSHSYHEEFGLPVVTLRPFNVYGPRQVGEGAIREMILRSLKGTPLTIYGGGTQIRAWCFVDDFIDGLMLALEKNEAVGKVFNLGNPQGTAANINLAHAIIRLCQSSSKIEFKEHPGPEVEIRVPSIERAAKLLGYEPKTDLEAGIQKAIEWYRQQLEKGSVD